MINYPEWFGVGVQVSRFESDRPADAVIDEAVATARRWGRPDITCWITEDSRPADLEQRLIVHGAEHSNTVHVLALEIGDTLPDFGPMPDVTAELVTSHEQRVEAARVNIAGWAPPEQAVDERLEREIAQMEKDPEQGDIRVLARLEGVPVCTGGCTVVDGVARLWGGSTLESARGRGAYRAVLAERIRLARDAGATLALVKGRFDTSAPILNRLGFTDHGQERLYTLPC